VAHWAEAIEFTLFYNNVTWCASIL
jgi:hypothetical protein